MQPPFESWFLSSPPVPPRSRLYSLEPIGIGTAFVESLTGYTARLAEAHSVSVGDLLGRVLSELFSDPKAPIITAAAKACRVGGHGFRACRYGVNGVTDRAESWAQALEAATARRDLRYLTLLPLRRVLPEELFRRRRAWCSVCYDQWRADGRIIYEPLIWAIETSSLPPCPRPTARLRLPPLCATAKPARSFLPAGILRALWRLAGCAGRRQPPRGKRGGRDVVMHSGGSIAGDAPSGQPGHCP